MKNVPSALCSHFKTSYMERNWQYFNEYSPPYFTIGNDGSNLSLTDNSAVIYLLQKRSLSSPCISNWGKIKQQKVTPRDDEIDPSPYIYEIRKFNKKLRRQLQRKRRIKIELCVKLSLLRLFHVYHVVQNTRIALSLAWYERFSCKGKEWRFTAASSRCRQNLKYENFTSSFGRLQGI